MALKAGNKMEQFDALIVGAGVIGLACARELSQRHFKVLIIERNDTIGGEISSRNSEVIHAGIYYKPGSLKSYLCVRGKELLYEYCQNRNINFKKCQKLIVATERAHNDHLFKIMHRAKMNYVEDLQYLEKEDAKKLEPELNCYGALLSPSTGIIDTHSYMLSMAADIERYDGIIALRTPLHFSREKK